MVLRTFSAKFAHLGFEAQGKDLDKADPVTPGTCSGDTHISKRHCIHVRVVGNGLLIVFESSDQEVDDATNLL